VKRVLEYIDIVGITGLVNIGLKALFNRSSKCIFVGRTKLFERSGKDLKKGDASLECKYVKPFP
jgi:hypothetical protein